MRVILQGLAPLAIAACGVAFFAAVFAVGNGRPGAIAVLEVGSVVISVAGVEAGLLVGARLLAIGAVSIAYATTTSPTALVDSLVQQAGVSDRFAYGALAAYGALPRLAGDLRALREARALRGLRADLHPRLLVALLVLAIRHAERLGVAMDARAGQADAAPIDPGLGHSRPAGGVEARDCRGRRRADPDRLTDRRQPATPRRRGPGPPVPDGGSR